MFDSLLNKAFFGLVIERDRIKVDTIEPIDKLAKRGITNSHCRVIGDSDGSDSLTFRFTGEMSWFASITAFTLLISSSYFSAQSRSLISFSGTVPPTCEKLAYKKPKNKIYASKSKAYGQAKRQEKLNKRYKQKHFSHKHSDHSFYRIKSKELAKRFRSLGPSASLQTSRLRGIKLKRSIVTSRHNSKSRTDTIKVLKKGFSRLCLFY